VLFVLALGVIIAAWFGRGGRYLAYDSVRDVASARGLMAGRWGEDAALPGLPMWYPPGWPGLVAAVALAIGRPAFDVVSWSGYVTTPLVLLAPFVLARRLWGRGSAWAALVAVFVGSLWWMRHAALPLPAVFGAALALAAFLVWDDAFRLGAPPWRAVLAGLLAAATTWIHPLCGALVLGAIAVHTVFCAWIGRRDGPARGWPLAPGMLATVTALAAAAPVWFQQLTLPRLNPEPVRWFAPELHDPRFALQSHAPLMVVLGLAGIVMAARDAERRGWLVAYAGIAVTGELAGYAGHDLGWPLPVVLPHEFQWHAQLAFMLAGARAAGALADQLRPARGGGWWARSGPLRLAIVLALAVGPCLADLPGADLNATRIDATWTSTLASAGWIESHTPRDAVIACAPEVGLLVSALTGRRVMVLPAGHMNPATDAEARFADLDSLTTTRDPSEFARIAARYGAGWLLVRAAGAERDSLEAFYAAWPMLQPVAFPTPDVVLFRIRPALE
jgi:hypothetical protein